MKFKIKNKKMNRFQMICFSNNKMMNYNNYLIVFFQNKNNININKEKRLIKYQKNYKIYKCKLITNDL